MSQYSDLHRTVAATFAFSQMRSVAMRFGLLLFVVFGFEASWAASPPAPVDYSNISAVNLVNRTPKGNLHNPYNDSQASIVAQGAVLFRSYPCSGCHGGNAGGGMCPPLTTSDWIYGGDDDTLFRLVTLGSIDLQKKGYTRQGLITTAGPMPSMGPMIKNSDDLWKILAFIRPTSARVTSSRSTVMPRSLRSMRCISHTPSLRPI